MDSGATEHAYSYDNAGHFTPVVTVDPPICQPMAEYTCEYKGGPYEGDLDLCDFVHVDEDGNESSGKFDPETGEFDFVTYDKFEFPPGEYDFEFTGQLEMNDLDWESPVTMVVEDPCPQAALNIVEDPFAGGHSYNLKQPALVLPFNVFSIGEINTFVSCGEPQIEVLQEDGTAINSALFHLDVANGQFSVGPSADLSLAGVYTLKFKYFYADGIANFVESEIFTVEVIDYCIGGEVSLIAPTLDNFVYTITDTEIIYEIPAWISTPQYCADQVQYQLPSEVASGNGGSAISINEGKMMIYYEGSLDLTDDTVEGKTETIELTVSLGDIESTATFQVTFKNPCLDSAFYGVEAVTPPDFSYVLYTGVSTWQHDKFTFSASEPAKILCGEIVYTPSMGGLTEDTITYSADTRLFTLETGDMALLDASPYTYNVKSHLKNYPLFAVTEATGTITFSNPCTSPSVTAND